MNGGDSMLLGSEQPLACAYDVALLDLDGVCFAGAARIEHAATGVNGARALGMKLSFVTNNASRAPQTVADKLADNDIEGHASEVFSAAMDAAALLREHIAEGELVYVIGGDGLRQALLDEGFLIAESADEHPAAVAQGWAPQVDWAMMTEGAYAIGAGAIHVATNTDATLPTERGFALGNGSLVAAVANATGKEYLAAGKPFPGIYTRALARSGGTTPLAVGDRLNTDLVGARAAGIASMHVLTGVSTARDVLLAEPGERPSYLHTDLRGLLEPHPAPSREGDWWRVRNERVRLVTQAGSSCLEWDGHGRLETNMGDDAAAHLTLDAYRAAAAASWEWADARRAAGDASDSLELPQIVVEAP